MILTRYLYSKSAVIASLKTAIQEGDKNKALFWAYELYRSGFQTEVIQLLFSIFDESYYKFKNLRKCIQKKYEKWKEDYKEYPTFVGTFVINMIARNHMLQDLKPESNNVISIVCANVDEFDTKPIEKPSKYLQLCCKYPTVGGDSDNIFCHTRSQTQWIYYASFSPIWNMRLQKYGAKVDHLLKDVVFDDDDQFEVFMEKFGFEPDEQPLSIQKYCLGIL
uniref:Uncharacterized protein n=1 Tax=viral metagenome TaxID=1070528 RepID=A0A6C0HY96_9ZZZZ